MRLSEYFISDSIRILYTAFTECKQIKIVLESEYYIIVSHDTTSKVVSRFDRSSSVRILQLVKCHYITAIKNLSIVYCLGE